MIKKLRYFWIIPLLIISACSSPKTLTEKDLATAQLTEKDLPPGFVKSEDSAIEGLASMSSNLQKVMLKSEPTGKTFNSAMFTREENNADFGIVSFEYFFLTPAEKNQLTETTKKQDTATCCELIAAFMGGSADACKNEDMMRLISVLADKEKVGEGSLECSIHIQGKSHFELGYFYQQNVLSFIFEGYSQYNAEDTITAPFVLKDLLKLKASKLGTAGAG